MNIQERLKTYMESQGLKLKSVATKAEIPQGRFYRLINGESKLTTEDFEKICKKGLDVDPSIFFQ